MWLVALLSCLATLAVVFLALNLGAGEKKIEQQLDAPVRRPHDPQFARSMGVLLGPPIIDGNRVAGAAQRRRRSSRRCSRRSAARRRSITFETYIYWSGSDRPRVRRGARRARARRRKVHVLLDWVGSVKIDERLRRGDEGRRRRGRALSTSRTGSTWRALNNRTHRKLLVVDGTVGFTGGVGIADQWRGHAQDPEHWRDTHFRVEGPVVAQMQAVFMDNWMKATGRVLHGEDYFPPLPPRGEPARADVQQLARPAAARACS